MKTIVHVAVIGLTSLMLANAAPPPVATNCKKVVGKAQWTLIPPSLAPATEPLGRVLGPTTGDLKATVTAYLTGLNFIGGVFQATSVETWVTGPGDILVFNGNATFTPISATDVDDHLTLTVANGFGAYAGATGMIDVRGIGHSFLPGPALGSTFFDVRYEGNICTVN